MAARHAVAGAVLDGTELETVSKEFERLGMIHFAAESAAQAAVTYRLLGHLDQSGP